MLSRINIMDYSFLMGIERRSEISNIRRVTSNDKSNYRRGTNNKMDAACLRRHKFVSTNNLETYHISVIDYLQQWNLNKKSERFLKTVFLGKKGDELSAVEPVFY